MNEDIGLEGLYREYFPKVYSISFKEQYALIINPVHRALYAARFKLPERDRMLVYYKYGFSYHEIADKFRMNESTLASAIWRAKERLRKELEKTVHLEEYFKK